MYIRTLDEAALIQFCVDASVKRAKGQQDSYNSIVSNYDTLNLLLRGQDSAYTAALASRSKRSFLHQSPPKKRMLRSGNLLSVAPSSGGVAKPTTRQFTSRNHKALVKHARKYALPLHGHFGNLVCFCASTQCPIAMHACRQAQHLVTTGSVLPLPPHQPAEKPSKHYPVLQEVHAFLLEGRTTAGVPCLPFRSLQQAAKYSPLIHNAMEAMNIKTYGSLWVNLQKAFPGLKKTALNVKGIRDAAQAQTAAKRLLGREPMEFVKTVHDAHPLTRRVLDLNYRYFYTWSQIQKNVFLDGGKIEPQVWVRMQKGITQVGARRHPICYQLLMKTVSTHANPLPP